MRKGILILLFISLPVFLWASPLTKQDKILEGLFITTLMIDWGQTLYISEYPDKYWESNPILGENPSRERVNAYFASCIVGHILITRILPPKWRTAWQTIWIGIELKTIHNNWQVGIRVRF